MITDYDHDHCFRCGKEIEIDKVFSIEVNDEFNNYCPECFYGLYDEHLGDCPTQGKQGCPICEAKRDGEK